LEGYALPQSDGSRRNRANIGKAAALLDEAGWRVQDGQLRNESGQALELTVLLRRDGLLQQAEAYMQIYARALERLGITLNIETTDSAQYAERERSFDFDLTFFRRAMSLSPGNEQQFYWSSEAADQPGSRNLMGMRSPAAEAMIRAMLEAESRDEYISAVRALDRVLISGRYVLPIHQYSVGRIAHLAELTYPKDRLPVYGDGVWFLPEVWWSEANQE
jgi:peptide/nickel transport system substrate-binding protein